MTEEERQREFKQFGEVGASVKEAGVDEMIISRKDKSMGFEGTRATG